MTKKRKGMSKAAALKWLLANLRRRLFGAEDPEEGDPDLAARLEKRIGHVEKLMALADRG